MKREAQDVICIVNKGYSASLELRKLYQVIPDKIAAELRQMRVIDESGEDCLCPADYFAPVQLPQAIERTVRRVTAVTRMASIKGCMTRGVIGGCGYGSS